jgi:AcrR family transcriptional regulator
VIADSDPKARPYKQAARAQAQEQTRDALLDAAADEFYKGRWRKTSLEALSSRAGVTKQTLLRHFGSKDGLIEAAIRRTSEIVRKERAQAPIGDVPGAVHNLMDHYERYGDLVMRLLAEGHLFYLIRKVTDHGRELHHEWTARTFEPQLSGLGGEVRERRLAQLVTVCDVYVWKLLRGDMKLSVPQAELALIELIEGIVKEPR